ncbi:AbrB family transcriptional regulator [Bradyrhizobium sp. AZCC 2289]|uniref:AbrB family transcriptional regulator n=1 Tax=Bradyrhizobium sp. AZCC 2289 TaxID=3117026 RepID=UPI002FEF9062
MTLIPATIALAVPSRARILNTLETLAIGSAGGLLFLWAHLPGGLISGAMIAVGIAALAGRPLGVPPLLTQSVLLLLGISLGSLVSRQLIQHMGSYPLTIGLLALATFCSTFGSSLYLQRVHGWDQTSAFLAGSPGALSQITILAAERGADVPAIAVVQTMRVIILTAALPLLLSLTGVAPSSPPAVISAIASPLELAALIVASVAVALSFIIAIIISAMFVAVIALTTHVRFADVIVAFAPGAMDAMLALALTLHIDPIFVGAHHLSRFVFVTITTPGIIHLFGRPQDDVDD